MTGTADRVVLQADAPGPRRGASRRGSDTRTLPGRQDWSTWPHYQAAAAGFRGYWYPVMFANQATGKPTAVTLVGERIAVVRDRGDGRVYALRDRCPHRGVPLSHGNQQFDGTLSCPYHGWTFELGTGRLCAAITDGPESPIVGKVVQPTYPVAERLGMVWVYVPEGLEEAPPIDDQLPEELVSNPAVVGARIQDRPGNWRWAAENGYDEGHAKYLHRESLWRLFKSMPVWNQTQIKRHGRWIYRVQTEQHWTAEFPGLGRWDTLRWWKIPPPKEVTNIGNTTALRKTNPTIAAPEFPGFASMSMPGVLRIAYPTFIHYEFYVPVDEGNHLYVGVMAAFEKGVRTLPFMVKYLAAVRWLFHGQFSSQDKWMVEVTDAPPERLYRPDQSILQWRTLAEDVTEERIAAAGSSGEGSDAAAPTERRDGPADGPAGA